LHWRRTHCKVEGAGGTNKTENEFYRPGNVVIWYLEMKHYARHAVDGFVFQKPLITCGMFPVVDGC
jgi:hypothetical protein